MENCACILPLDLVKCNGRLTGRELIDAIKDCGPAFQKAEIGEVNGNVGNVLRQLKVETPYLEELKIHSCDLDTCSVISPVKSVPALVCGECVGDGGDSSMGVGGKWAISIVVLFICSLIFGFIMRHYGRRISQHIQGRFYRIRGRGGGGRVQMAVLKGANADIAQNLGLTVPPAIIALPAPNNA